MNTGANDERDREEDGEGRDAATREQMMNETGG